MRLNAKRLIGALSHNPIAASGNVAALLGRIAEQRNELLSGAGVQGQRKFPLLWNSCRGPDGTAVMMSGPMYLNTYEVDQVFFSQHVWMAVIAITVVIQTQRAEECSVTTTYF